MAQRSSRTAVDRLNRINRTVIVLVVAAIVVAALLLPGIVGGATCRVGPPGWRSSPSWS
jgi:uncharacterized membrane protein